MAESDKKPAGTSDEAADAQGSGRSQMFSRLVIAGFVVGVVVVQLVIAMVFMSSIAQSANSGTPTLEEQVEQEMDVEAGVASNSSASTVEVELGQFSVTSFQPSSEVTLRIDFSLFGTVTEDNESQFLTRLERSKNRVREQVIVTVRNAELTDLTDPGLGLIKRRILTKVNRTLGKPLLRTVVISEFSFVEQ